MRSDCPKSSILEHLPLSCRVSASRQQLKWHHEGIPDRICITKPYGICKCEWLVKLPINEPFTHYNILHEREGRIKLSCAKQSMNMEIYRYPLYSKETLLLTIFFYLK